MNRLSSGQCSRCPRAWWEEVGDGYEEVIKQDQGQDTACFTPMSTLKDWSQSYVKVFAQHSAILQELLYDKDHVGSESGPWEATLWYCDSTFPGMDGMLPALREDIQRPLLGFPSGP